MLLPSKRAQIVAELGMTPMRLQSLILGLKEEQLNWKSVPEKRSVKEVIIHLTLAEKEIYQKRNEKILKENDALLDDLVNEKVDLGGKGVQDASSVNIKEYLREFGRLRSESIDFFKKLTEELWAKKGRHSQFGDVTLERSMLWMVEQDQHHLKQIKTTLQEMKNTVQKG